MDHIQGSSQNRGRTQPARGQLTPSDRRILAGARALCARFAADRNLCRRQALFTTIISCSTSSACRQAGANKSRSQFYLFDYG
ncbi:unnamed protein product [Sphagnum balticum]